MLFFDVVSLLIGVDYKKTIFALPPLTVLGVYYAEHYPYAETPVNFATWFIYAIGISATLFLLIFGSLGCVYVKRIKCVCPHDNLKRQYEELGKLRRDEIVVASAQVFEIIFWFLNGVVLVPYIGDCDGADATHRTNCTDSGGLWTSRFTSYESGIACLAAFSLFLVPSHDRKGERILDWEYVSSKMPWGILFLLGGGFAISKGFTDSGLSIVIANTLGGLEGVPTAAIVLIIALTVTFLTEFTSNTATASLMIPILDGASKAMGIDPLTLLLPGTYATG